MVDEVLLKSDNTSKTASSPTNSVAGLTNYRRWDKVSKDLLAEVEQEDELGKAESAEALGHTRQPFSEAEAAEKEKLLQAKKTKAVLDSHKQREVSRTLLLEQEWLDKQLNRETIDITRRTFEESYNSDGVHKRVLCLSNMKGPVTINLSSDLSFLESSSTVENDKGAKETVKIAGVTKVFLSNLRDITVITRCKIITSSLEISHCSNLRIQIYQEKISTIQCDLSHDLLIEFIGVDIKRDNLLFGDINDKIYHAGVKNLKLVARKKSGEGKRLEKTMDYLADGAIAEGTATAEEYQFVTRVLHGELVTERLLRLHNKHITERELQEQLLREKVEQMNMNSSAKDHVEGVNIADDNVEEEIFLSSHPSAIGGTISSLQLKGIVFSCEQQKTGGNEAFQNGEYMQAILLYTRAIEESAGLDEIDNTLFPARHVLFANRSACFLKMGHHENALEDAVHCVELQPSYIKGHFRKGLALHAMKRYDEAMPCLVEALRMEPNNKQVQQAVKFCEVNLAKEMRKRMDG